MRGNWLDLTELTHFNWNVNEKKIFGNDTFTDDLTSFTSGSVNMSVKKTKSQKFEKRRKSHQKIFV